MRGGPIARRYAKALLDLAEESNQLDQVSRHLEELVGAWDASPELRDVFENPGVGTEQRKKVIGAIADRMGLSPLVKNTLLLLSDRRRLRHLPEIADAYRQLAEEKAGLVRAEVVTATAMPESYFAELQRTLESVTGKKVVLVKREDPSLIAGVVTRVGDKVFDGSVQNRLNELREELLT